jgi:hypothetical protein
MKLYFIGYKGRGIISRLIRFVTRGNYSHVGQIISEDPKPKNSHLKELSAYEKIGEVGVTSPESHKNNTPYDVFSVKVSKPQYDAFLLAKGNIVGQKYDYGGILDFLFDTSLFNNKNKWFCSEAETYCLKKAKINAFDWFVQDPKKTSPHQLLSSPIFNYEFSGLSSKLEKL